MSFFFLSKEIFFNSPERVFLLQQSEKGRKFSYRWSFCGDCAWSNNKVAVDIGRRKFQAFVSSLYWEEAGREKERVWTGEKFEWIFCREEFLNRFMLIISVEKLSKDLPSFGAERIGCWLIYDGWFCLVLFVASIGKRLSWLAVSTNAIESIQKTTWLSTFWFTSLWQQFLDEQEFWQDEGDDGDDQGFLGDQCNSEESNDGESGELQFNQTEDWQKWLQDLLLLSTCFWDQWTDWWFNFFWDGSSNAACSRCHVEVQWAFLEEALGAFSDEVFQCIFTVFDWAGLFNDDSINVCWAGITSGLFNEWKSTEEFNFWVFEEFSCFTVDLLNSIIKFSSN